MVPSSIISAKHPTFTFHQERKFFFFEPPRRLNRLRTASPPDVNPPYTGYPNTPHLHFPPQTTRMILPAACNNKMSPGPIVRVGLRKTVLPSITDLPRGRTSLRVSGITSRTKDGSRSRIGSFRGRLSPAPRGARDPFRGST